MTDVLAPFSTAAEVEHSYLLGLVVGGGLATEGDETIAELEEAAHYLYLAKIRRQAKR